MTSLVVHGANSVSVSLDAGAITKRDAAIATASFVTEINTDAELEEAVAAFRELKAIDKAAENDRVTVKAPVLEISRAIDNEAKRFREPMLPEIQRIDRLMADYARRKEAARREAERKRQDEIRRAQEEEQRRLKALEDERQAKEREAAEVAKAAAELLGEDAGETVAQAQAVVRQEVAAKAEAITRESQAQQTLAITETAAAVVAIKPAGTAVRREPKFRVTDPLALANKYPDWVTITPKLREITADIRTAPEFDGEKQVYPGVIAWWEERMVVR